MISKKTVYGRDTQTERDYLILMDCIMVIAMLSFLFNDQKGDNNTAVQRAVAKESEVFFF